MKRKYSESKNTNMVLRMIDDSIGLDNIDAYIIGAKNREFMEMRSLAQAKEIFKESIDNFLNSLSYEELNDLKIYTGYDYKFINSILRGNWTYDEHGLLTDDKKKDYQSLSMRISRILNKFETPYFDFVSFRGTTIDSFKSYGITDLSQLECMKGQYMYESAFTSTSILRDTSYINKSLDDGRYCNIGIKYLIPSESNDGALLISSNISYTTGQNEFLLNSGTLSKVVDVFVDELNNTALLTVMLVPKRMYDMSYSSEKTKK